MDYEKLTTKSMWILLAVSSLGSVATCVLWEGFSSDRPALQLIGESLQRHWLLSVALSALGIANGAALYWGIRSQWVPISLRLVLPLSFLPRAECLAVPVSRLELGQDLIVPYMHFLGCFITASGMAAWHLFRRPIAPSLSRSRMMDACGALLAMAPGAVLVLGLGVVAWGNLLWAPHWSFFAVAGGLGALRMVASYRAWTSHRPAWAIGSWWSLVACAVLLPLLWGYDGDCRQFGIIVFLGTALTVYFTALLVLRPYLRVRLQLTTEPLENQENKEKARVGEKGSDLYS